MGIYVYNKDLLAKRLGEDAGEPGSLHDFGYNILPRMVKTDHVFAYEFKGYWHDIGTIEAYYEANMELLVPRPRFTLDNDWPILDESNILPVCRTSEEGNIVNSPISSGCVISGHVENSVLSPGVHVAEQATVRNSVVMADVSICNHSSVDGCIIDENVNIGKFSYVGFGDGLLPENLEITIRGKDGIATEHTVIGRNCSVSPGVRPDSFGDRLIPTGTTPVNS